MASRLPAFTGATGWLNTEPLTPAALRGRVVAVQFWTYTCINWLRTLPYVRAWAATYADAGLVVLGVHTPEFGVEHDVENVRRAARDLGVDHPIALDNDYAVWDAFANHYWPALYVADADGWIRHHHFGEGGYDAAEQAIRRMLTAAGSDPLPDRDTAVEIRGIELEADWDHVRSPETYVGLGRSTGFVAREPAVLHESRDYTSPPGLDLNEWALDGRWTFHVEDAVCDEPNGRVVLRFHARDLNLILAPPAPHSAARFRVRLDDRAPGEAHGLDVDEHGDGTVGEPRLYQLVRQRGPITDRQFELEFLDAGAAALCFTFG
jgi:hypothetical protein